MKRSILHIDMDAFFAAVEQRERPELRGKPVIVGAPPDKRGVVATCSYEARKFGIHSAMPSCEAYRRCPDAIFVHPEMSRYQDASRRVFSIFERYSPKIEPLSIDEAFLDVTGVLRLYGPAHDIAVKLRREIKEEVGLTASIGIAHNKFLAKLGSEKAKPDGLFVMPEKEQEIVDYLATLNVGELWGVGRVSSQTLISAGYFKVADLQNCNPEKLAGVVGRRFAEYLLDLAFGRDYRDVKVAVAEKSISKETTFNEDIRDRETLKSVLQDLCDEVGSRLRAQGFLATVCRIKIRWSSFRTITRQRQFDTAICDDFSIRELALELFENESLIAPVRLIGIGVAGLTHSVEEQMLLFDESGKQRKKREILSRTVDIIRSKLGDDVIKRGSSKVRMKDEL